jgi:hypothetical protein
MQRQIFNETVYRRYESRILFINFNMDRTSPYPATFMVYIALTSSSTHVGMLSYSLEYALVCQR